MALDRAQAEALKIRGEAWLRLRETDDFRLTVGEELAKLSEEPNILDLDAVPFDKLAEAAWNVQGQKMMLHHLADMMRRWEDDAKLDMTRFEAVEEVS